MDYDLNPKKIMKMKTLKINFKKIVLLSGVLLLPLSMIIHAQKGDKDFSDLEKMQDKNEDIYVEIYRLIDEYPEFNYKYVYNDGELEEVIVEGVDDKTDAKRVEVWLYDFKRNKEMMKNIPTRTGIYYSVDKEAEPENGYREMYSQIQEELTYPEGAKDAGVEGNVYVKMVIDSQGEIAYITAAEDIETPYSNWVEDLKNEAVDAVKTTSGNWEPAEVNGKDVASLAVVPVIFNFKKDPALPALVR